MTSTQELSAALEALEKQALDLATQRSPEGLTWEELQAKLSNSGLSKLAPLDPDAARQSGEEFDLLLKALRQVPSVQVPALSGQTARAGYLIEGERGLSEARVRPAFAEALAVHASASSLLRDFPDLWAVDLGLWQQLVSGARDFRALALSWLSSPGRRLVQDLSVLHHDNPPHKRQFGASDFSPERLEAVTGPLPLQQSASDLRGQPWHELHAAVPGGALLGWLPANEDVSSVLRILEGRRGDPVFLRGAALAWLLDRAATHPIYALEELQRDLREDLMLAFTNGFPDARDESRHAQLRAATRLETVCLQHTAHLTVREGRYDTAYCWNVARWLQGCTFRSPFFGGDEEALTARLRALLPPDASAIPSREDVLDPSLLGDDGEGLDLAELALVTGAARHYWPEASHPQLRPTPLPLVNALRRVAARVLNAGEAKAEALLARAQAPAPHTAEPEHPVLNALRWEAPHLAPPLVARWLMSNHRIAWLLHASPEARQECLRLFVQKPERHEWLAFALYNEGRELDATTRAEAAKSWREAVQVTQGHLGSQGALALMAAGLLDQLSTEEALHAALLAQRAAPDWRHRTLEALAEAAEKQDLSPPWAAALDGLLRMCEDEGLEAQERMKAALLALRQASATRRPERTEYLQRLANVAFLPPFNQNVALRRELRRLGLSPAPDSHRGV